MLSMLMVGGWVSCEGLKRVLERNCNFVGESRYFDGLVMKVCLHCGELKLNIYVSIPSHGVVRVVEAEEHYSLAIGT